MTEMVASLILASTTTDTSVVGVTTLILTPYGSVLQVLTFEKVLRVSLASLILTSDYDEFCKLEQMDGS